MAGKLVIATGISGCGRKEKFLPGLINLCNKNGKKIKVYNVGDAIPEWAWESASEELPSKTILFIWKQAMNLAQGGVFKDILGSLEKDLKEFDIVLINLHIRFLWWRGSIYVPVRNEIFIANLIEKGFEIAMFVSFIDHASDILKRLKDKEQWKDQNLNEKDLWLWQNEEVNDTKSFVLFLGKILKKRINFFVMPISQPPETLYYLVFEPWRPIVYIQMPLSHIHASKLKKVNWLIGELRKMAVVFDPMNIETGVVEREALDKVDDNAEVMVRHTQTGYRDTEWFIPQCDICLAYYVELVLTLGVVDETATAAGLGKQTWAIFPSDASPFLPFRVPPEKIFKNPEECLAAFKAYAEAIEKDYKEKNGMAQAQTKESENA